MAIRQLTEGLSHYSDLSLAVGTDKAVASQTTHISEIWIGPSRDPKNLRMIIPAAPQLSWAPDGLLVYASPASGNLDLWVMEPDGTGQRQLSSDPAVDYRPAVSPDNRHIVFVSNRTGSFQVWRMNRDGSNQVQITGGGGGPIPALQFRPTGNGSCTTRPPTGVCGKLRLTAASRCDSRTLLTNSPAVSPDGRLVACGGRSGSRRELLILSTDAGRPLRTFEFAEWAPHLQWAPDGKAVIYSALTFARSSLMKQSMAGGRPTEVVGFERYELFDFGYSFDNRSLAVTRGEWQHDVVLLSGFGRQ